MEITTFESILSRSVLVCEMLCVAAEFILLQYFVLLQENLLSNLEVSGEKKNDLNVVPARLRFPSDFSDSQRLLQEGESSEHITSEDIIANIFITTLETSDSPVDDELDTLDTHEPPPPGCESNFKLPPLHCKFRPVRSKESIPEIEEYVATALCRQKLHKDVMRDWKSLFMKCYLNGFLASWKGNHQLSRKETLAPRKLKTFTQNKKQVQYNISNQRAEKPRKPCVRSSVKILAKRSKKLSTDSHSLKESLNEDMPSIDFSVRKPSQQKMTNADRRDHCMYFSIFFIRLEKLDLYLILFFFYYFAGIIKDVTKFHKEKVGNDAIGKVICKKSQDVGMADEFDDELLITRLRSKSSFYYSCDGILISGFIIIIIFFIFFGVSILSGISRNKKKELREGTNAAKSCEEISTSAEESGETVDCKDHEENLSNKSSQKMQKGE